MCVLSESLCLCIFYIQLSFQLTVGQEGGASWGVTKILEIEIFSRKGPLLTYYFAQLYDLMPQGAPGYLPGPKRVKMKSHNLGIFYRRDPANITF